MQRIASRLATRAVAAAARKTVQSRSVSCFASGFAPRSAPASVVCSTVSSRRIPSRFFAVEVEKVPALGDSISEGTVISWQKAVGQWVNQDDVLATIETDKVAVDIRATKSGLLVEQAAKENAVIKVGADLAKIDTAAAKPAAAAAPAPKAAAAPAPAQAAAPAAAAPAAAPKAAAAPAAPTATAPVLSNAKQISRTERRVPATRMRMTIAKRLKDAQNNLAMLTTFNEIDMSALQALRNKHKEEFTEKHGVKLGFMSAFVKAAGAALQKSPNVNAYLDGNEIVYRDYVDISVAVSTPTGLVVPVLRNVESMTFAGVESSIAALGQKARKGQIAIEDMVGGTFTISNGGVYGSLFGTPIINPPQSAILGMHGVFDRPVAVNGKVEIRPMMYVALTYDHRLLDGSDAVLFLKDIKNYIEDPSRLLLDL